MLLYLLTLTAPWLNVAAVRARPVERPWLVLAVVLIVLAYGPSLAHLIVAIPFDNPGLRVW